MKIFLIFFGSVALALGCIGLAVPGLPTTPFLLLSAACYFKGSKKLHGWLTGHRLFGRIIMQFKEGRTKRRTMIFSILLMWIMIGLSAGFFIGNLHVRIAVLAAGLAGTFFMGKIAFRR
jgi:hypothetical protein